MPGMEYIHHAILEFMNIHNSGLIPERRTDRNGKTSTRWVKGAGSNNTPAELGSHTAVGAESTVSENVNWATTSRYSAGKIAAEVGKNENISDPKKLWKNFDFYTGMLESQHSDIALAYIRDDQVAPYLLEAWASKDGNHPSIITYRGLEGWEDYEAAATTFTKAVSTATNASADPEMKAIGEELVSFHNKTMAAAEDRYGYREHRETMTAAASKEPSFLERLKEAKEEGDFTSPFLEKFDEISEIVVSGVDEILEQHSPEHDPSAAGIRGNVVSWSDINPFKRRKKQK